ncbi:MAG: hypothetical protein F9K29_23775 [Hyphomicrobiaceae bacterium]|nr:MAG: hypothetical protein F9K29_23775 [Hyphomicrobiaceae bacterium]
MGTERVRTHRFLDCRLAGLLACLAAFVSGHLSLARIIPAVAGLPQWALEVRSPLLAGAVLAGIVSLFQESARPRKRSWALLLPALYGGFTLAYVFLPFPLVRTSADLIAGIVSLALFVWLYDPRYRNAVAAAFISLSSLLILVSLVRMGEGGRLQFAGSPITLVRIAAVSMFLLLYQAKGWLRLALLALHGLALVASVQLTAFMAVALAGLAAPLIFIGRTLSPRLIIANLVALALGCAAGGILTFNDISSKVAFRLKQDEQVTVAAAHNGPVAARDGAFPGGLVESTVLRDGRPTTVRLPDFERDTRVCIDDRSDRIKLFATALALDGQAPDEWGWGDQAFVMPLTRFGEVAIHKQPHNILLDVLVTRGPWFLAVFLFIIYVVALQGMIAVHRVPTTAPFLIAAAFILLAAQWSGDYFDFRWFFLLTFPAVAAGFPAATSLHDAASTPTSESRGRR